MKLKDNIIRFREVLFGCAKRYGLVLLMAIAILPSLCTAQQVSPLQTGHYSTAFSGVRDMAKADPGFLSYGITNTPLQILIMIETATKNQIYLFQK
jgi:hypothetical protein